jgi:hypothetical protein
MRRPTVLAQKSKMLRGRVLNPRPMPNSTEVALTTARSSGTTDGYMSRWKINASGLLVLSSVTFFMLLIVVSPYVDLPDTAFHRGTAPGIVNARVTTAPALLAIAVIVQLTIGTVLTLSSYHSRALPSLLDPNFRPILFRSIRC